MSSCNSVIFKDFSGFSQSLLLQTSTIIPTVEKSLIKLWVVPICIDPPASGAAVNSLLHVKLLIFIRDEPACKHGTCAKMFLVQHTCRHRTWSAVQMLILYRPKSEIHIPVSPQREWRNRNRWEGASISKRNQYAPHHGAALSSSIVPYLKFVPQRYQTSARIMSRHFIRHCH